MPSLNLPKQTINVLRGFVDLSLDAYGIDCALYIPTTASANEAEKLDVFAAPEDLEYTEYSCKVFIVWNPGKSKLRKFGIFTEDEIPMLCWFPNKARIIDESGSAYGDSVEIDITRKSYFTISTEFIPEDFSDFEEFVIIDPIIKGMQEKVVLQVYKCVPRRV